MKSQKELKELYKKEVCQYWKDEKMQKYCINKVAYIVELTDGSIIELEKQSIIKNFCFGHGLYGISTAEDEKNAYSMANVAQTSFEYFKKKNLEDINNSIENLNECINGFDECYIHSHYTGQSEDSILRTYSTCSFAYSIENAPWRWSHCHNLRKASKKDIELLIAGLNELKKMHEKKIDTYLKKYGLSKVHSWTYLVD